MIFLEWGDGQYPFELAGREIEELQIKCGNVGFGAIFQRVMLGQWFLQDIQHTVRLGLIGGGMAPIEANRLVEMYCGREEITVPLAGGAGNAGEVVAKAILQSVMLGFKGLPPGEQEVGEKTAGSTSTK